MSGAEDRIRIIVVDDHPLVHQGMAAITGIHDDLHLVGSAATVEEGLELLAQQPHVALVDLRLAGESGLELVEKGREVAPQCRFVIMTSALDAGVVRRAMAQEVAGYLLKDAMPEEMVRAIRLVAKGRPYMDPEVMQAVWGAVESREDPLKSLTERQRDVLKALGRGLGTIEIAQALNVTESTVKKHISEILAKLGLADRTQAALYAVAQGLVTLDDLAFNAAAPDKDVRG